MSTNKGMFVIKCLLLFVGVSISCGREWVPEKRGPCVFDRDCLFGYRCMNQQCILWEYSSSDGGVRLKGFGERCEANEECVSNYCLSHPEGGFCTRQVWGPKGRPNKVAQFPENNRGWNSVSLWP